MCRAVGTDALEDVILTWNINALNTNASIIITDGDFKNTGLIQRLRLLLFYLYKIYILLY